MKDPSKRPSVADQIRKGLMESIRHAKGEITLKSTVVKLPDKPPSVEAADVTRLRDRHGMSQAAFARLLNVAPKTIRSWEQGTRKPSRSALRLIQILDRDADGVLRLVGMSEVGSKSDKAKPK